MPASADLAQHIRTQHANGEDDQYERDDQIDEVTDDLTHLEVRRADLDREGRDTLARRRRRRQQRHEDTVVQRLEERCDDTSEIKRRSENDDVLRIQHLLSYPECFSDNVIMRIRNAGLDLLAGNATSIVAFDCEFWHKGKTFLPREVGGYHLTRAGDGWSSTSFFAVLPPPPGQLNRVSSRFSTVTPRTADILDILEETERTAPQFLGNNDSVREYFADKLVKPHLKPVSWLNEFVKLLPHSAVIVKGDMDLKALKSATTHYRPPLRIVDIARHNPAFSKRCGTAKLEGTYACIAKELDAGLKKAFPVGKAHNPVFDAAMTIQIAAWLAEKDIR